MLDILVHALIVSVGINMAMFALAYRLQSDKLTDISYAATFAAIAVYGYLNSDQTAYHTLALVLIGLWSVRLGGFLLYRVSKVGKDSRFDQMRSNILAFGRFWLLQGTTVWVLMIPYLLLARQTATITTLVAVGFGVWLAGLLIETAADSQKFKFNASSQNKDKWIEQGIWRYSRHPNYFGEILIWVGIYIIALQSLPARYALLALVSPLFISTLLLFVSGVPILEKSADKKWGNNQKYQRYKHRTSILVPLPRRRAATDN